MRAIKFVLWALVSLLLLAALGAGLFIATFDANSYRQLLGESVERATGRRLTINGELSLAIWPQIALRAEDLSLANPTGFDIGAPEQMLQAQALEATIALQPLLQREVKIDGVVLYSPRLLLKQQSAGTNNWSDLQQRFGNADSDASSQMAVQLNRVTLKDATIDLQQEGSLMRMSALNTQINFTGDTQFTLVADGVWHSDTEAAFTLRTGVVIGTAQTQCNDVELTLTLPMAATAPPEMLSLTIPALTIDADLDKASIKQGSARLANSDLSFEASFTHLLSAAQVTGSLTTTAADSAALLRFGAIDMPASLPAARLGALDLNATFTAALAGDASGSLQVHRFSARLGGAKPGALNLQANGTLDVNPAGHATGSLTLTPVDLIALTSALPELFDPGLLIPTTKGAASAPRPTLQSLQTAFEWAPAEAAKPATLSFSESRFVALGIEGSANGEIRLTEPASTTSAAIKLAKFSPKQVLTYFGEPILTTDPGALSSASGTLSLLQNAAGNHLQNLDITLDKSRLRGEFSVLPGSVPTVRFETTLDTLNATGYLAPDTATANPNGKTETADLLGDLVLPTQLLRAYDLAGAVRIGRLQLYDLLLNDAGARLTLGNGTAAVDSLSARLYGGSFIGKVGFSQPNINSSPKLSLIGDLQGVDVQALMQALSNAHDFTGRGNIQINMTGRGYTALEATQSAAGKFGLQLNKGTYTGINFGHELCKLYNRLRNKPAPPAPADNSTRFDTISASATVIDGAAQTNDLVASNAYLKLTGKGLTQLAKQSINYDLDIELTGPIEATNCETLTPYVGSRIPVRLTGTFANPTLRPDFGKLVQREIRRRVEDKLTEKLFDLLGGKKTEPAANPAPDTPPDTSSGP